MRVRLALAPLVLIALLAPAQQTRLLPVTVLDVHVDPPRPVPHARLQIGALNGTLIVSQGKLLTNDRGMVSVPINAETIGGGKLVISIEPADAPMLVIFEPAAGVVEALPENLTVKLLPKGSPVLLGPAQIEALIFKYTQNTNFLRAQNASLRAELSESERKLEAANQAKQELDEAQAEWAQQYGFSADEVRQKVAAWAADIRAQQVKATLRQRMLAAFVSGDYAEAARLAQQGEAESDNELDNEQEAYLKTLRRSLRDRLEFAGTEARAQQAQLRYDLGTAAFNAASKRAIDAHTKFPEDAELRGLWIRAAIEDAYSECEEAEGTDPAKSQALLQSAVNMLRSLLSDLRLPAEGPQWASTKINLGVALMNQSERLSGEESLHVLGEAVEAYRQALQVYTRETVPQEWAGTQNNLLQCAEASR